MANHKSAIKRHKQSVRQRARNQAATSRLRNLVKKMRLTLESTDHEKATAQLREVNKVLDKAVSKGIIKRNMASRKLARLARAADRTAAQPSAE